MSVTRVLQDQAICEVRAPELSAVHPCAARAEYIDRKLRTRLSDSFRHIADCVDLGDDSSAKLNFLEDRLGHSSVSPWVFCLYSKLVAELSNNISDGASAIVFDLATAVALPAAGIVPLGDGTVSRSWWNHFHVIFDTDGERPFNPQIPSPESFSHCQREVQEGLALLQVADPDWYDEVRSLLRMIVLGSARLDTDELFNGASTFFFWGGSLINAELRRSAVSIVDLLVHESSHLLLFGLSADGALLINSGEDRYTSPLRFDARPIDGILHGCFVASRVNLAMSRLLDSGALTEENRQRAVERRKLSAKTGRIGLCVLNEHAKPTEFGQSVLETLRSYWATTA